MAFDVQEHMGDLPKDRYHFGREIETRKYELTKISYLSGILDFAKRKKLSKRDQRTLDSYLGIVAQDIDHLNTTRYGNIASGGNAEVLARLVGAEILQDFPDVKEAEFGTPEVKYSYEFVGDKKSKKVEIKIHTEFTRNREEFEGSGGPITTVADFRYSKPKLDERTKRLNEEVGALYKERSVVVELSGE